MALIDLSNYNTLLHQSTAPRAGVPDGNYHFNTTTGVAEFIDATELPSYTPAADTGATVTIDAAAAGTFIITGGDSFTQYGLRAGMNVAVSGYVAGGNNSTFAIASITTTTNKNDTITVVDNTGMVTEAGGGNEQIQGASTPNALLATDGLRMEACYAFENQERNYDEVLRRHDRFTSGTFKFGGAYNWINGRTPSTVADRKKLRSSGWNELDASGNVIQIWFGSKGLSNIEATSTPSYQLSVQGTSVDADKPGQIDEAVLVYRDDNGDGTPDEDNRTYLAWSVRTYGQNPDRKESTTDLGITELGGYFTGYALNESVHLTTSEASYPIANVYNATRSTQAAPWTNMALNHITSPVVKSGIFSDETGTRLFSWELKNPGNADLYQCVAWLDAFSATTDEADELGVNTGHLGKDIDTWYSYNAAGKIVTKSGVNPLTEGLYIENVPVANQQDILQTDDGGTEKAYTFLVQIEAEVGAAAKADAEAWYHAFEEALYNSDSAITLTDSGSSPVKGLASTADGSNKIIFSRAYSGDLNCRFLCEGDGGATQAKTLFTIISQQTIAFACIPSTENNV